MTSPKPIYERLPDESPRAYSAFVIYRNMGEGRRISDAYKAYTNSDRKPTGTFTEWAAKFDWVERAGAWDDHIEAKARKQVERTAVKRKADMLTRHVNTGKALQNFGLQHLNENKKGPLKSADAINAIKVGVEMERKSEGLPEWIFEVVNADDNELARQYNELLAEIGSAGSGDETAGDDTAGSDTTEEADSPDTPESAAD